MKYIYLIRNSRNGRVYVGQTKYKDLRFKQHLDNLKKGNHFNYRLQKDYDKYGEGSFTYRVLESVQDKQGYTREDYWIDFYGGIDSVRVYNMQKSNSKNSDYRQRKSVAYTGNHPNKFKGMTHKEIYGEDKALEMRRLNSIKHKNKQPLYIPYKGKVKTIDGTMVEVTKDLITTIKTLRNLGYSYKTITTITGVKSNGIYNIVYDKIKLT